MRTSIGKALSALDQHRAENRARHDPWSRLGDLSFEPKPRSEGDKLVISIKDMVLSLRESAAVAHAVAVGDFTKDPVVHSEKDELGKALTAVVATERRVVAMAWKRSLSAICRTTPRCDPTATNSSSHLSPWSKRCGKSPLWPGRLQRAI
jgi:hypothetical protein